MPRNCQHSSGPISNETLRPAAPTTYDDAELFDPHRWPFFWITQAVGRYLQRLETGLKRVDLDISRWRVLMCLHQNRPTSVSEIAELAIVKLPTMTKIVQRMEADGLVRCEARISDGRVTEVSLTPAGMAAKQTAWTIANRLYREAFADISPDEGKTVNRLMKSIFDNLSNW